MALSLVLLFGTTGFDFDSIDLLPGGRIERERIHGGLCSTRNTVLQVESAWLRQLEDGLHDVSALISNSTKNALDPELLDEATLHGRILAIPASVDFNVIFFRRGEPPPPHPHPHPSPSLSLLL
jgi:hypothetical protein